MKTRAPNANISQLNHHLTVNITQTCTVTVQIRSYIWTFHSINHYLCVVTDSITTFLELDTCANDKVTCSIYCKCLRPSNGPRGPTVWNVQISQLLQHSNASTKAILHHRPQFSKRFQELLVLCLLKLEKLLSAQCSGWTNPNCTVLSGNIYFSYSSAYLRLINFEQLNTLIILIWNLDHKTSHSEMSLKGTFMYNLKTSL